MYGCKVWNSLDRDVQATEEPKRFKKALREKLLDENKKLVPFSKKISSMNSDGPLGEQMH